MLVPTFGSAQISIPLLKCYSLWIPSFRMKPPTSFLDVFPLPQVIFILKIFIDGCTFGAKSYCNDQFVEDILIAGTLVVTGVKNQNHLLRQNPNVLSYHIVASVICQFLWCELLELERTLIFFLCDGISYAFIISIRCLLHCQQLLVMAMFPLLFSQQCFYSIDGFVFWELIPDF